MPKQRQPGHKISEETKLKMSLAKRGAKNPNFGKPLSEETKAKISQTMAGREQPPEVKAKISETMRRKSQSGELPNQGKYWCGRNLSDEHKAAISKKLTGHETTLLTRQRISRSNKGRKGAPCSPEGKERMRKVGLANKGREYLDEWRVRQSEAQIYRIRLEKLLERTQLWDEIRKQYGIDMVSKKQGGGLNAGYKNWHKPLSEGKTRFKQGYYIPKNPEKCLTKQNIFRSSWEAKFFQWCDACPTVIRWASEPLAIPYRHPTANLEYCVKHGLDPNDPRFQKIQNYYTDVWIELANQDGTVRKVFIEIKPYSQSVPPTPLSPNATLKERKAFNREAETYLVNKAKWDAAERFCAEHGCEFWVVTEKELKTKFKLSGGGAA